MRETDTQTNELWWQLIKPLSNWFEQPFAQAAFTFDYVIIGSGFLSLVFLYFITQDPVSHNPSDWKVQNK